MQFREFFLMGGRIACARSIDTKDLDPARLQAAVEALRKLRGGAAQVSDGLPCTVRIGRPLTDEEWQVTRQYLPDMTEADARQLQDQAEEMGRRIYFLTNSGANQKYEIFRGEEEEKAGLHRTLALKAAKEPQIQGKHEISPERELEVIEDRIWRACPAVITGDLEFTLDILSSADLVAFSPYFAAAMLMNPV